MRLRKRFQRNLVFCLCGPALLAQDPMEAPSRRHAYFDGAVLAGVATGSLASDLPTTFAWGIRLGVHIPVVPRWSVRVSVENISFRLQDFDYRQGSEWLHQEASFESLRAGAELILEPRGLRSGGPYFLAGAGTQFSGLNTTVSRYQTEVWPYGKEEVRDAWRAERTSPFVTVGVGWRWRRTYTELRAFNVNYDSSGSQAPGVLPRTYRSAVVFEAALGFRL